MARDFIDQRLDQLDIEDPALRAEIRQAVETRNATVVELFKVTQDRETCQPPLTAAERVLVDEILDGLNRKVVQCDVTLYGSGFAN